MKRAKNRLDAMKRKLFDLLIVENINLIIPTGDEIVLDGVGEQNSRPHQDSQQD
jgi:hypothetical protein